MSDSTNSLHEAVLDRDAKKANSLIQAGEFVLLSTSGDGEDDGDNGAMIAEIEGVEMLVVFSEEKSAGDFVRDNGDLFEGDDEVDGMVVDGGALLDYMPDEFGILLDPQEDEALVIDPALIAEDPYEAGWLLKIRTSDASPLDRLMSQEEYDATCADQEH